LILASWISRGRINALLGQVAAPNLGRVLLPHPIYWFRWRLSRLQAWSRTISRACSRKCAPGEAGCEVAQRASRHGHTLAMSHATLAAYFNLQDRLAHIFVVSNRDIPEPRRHASSGRSPVLTANRTKSWSCSASRSNPFRFGSCGPLPCRFVELLIFFGRLVRGGVRGLGFVGCWEDREGGGPEGVFFICLCESMRLQDVETV